MSDFDTTAQVLRSLHAYLVDDVDIQAVLGATPRLYDHAPKDPIFPYLTYGTLRTENVGGDGISLIAHTLNLHIWSRYSGRSEVVEIVAHVARALENLVLPEDGPCLVSASVSYMDVFRAPDGRTLQGLVRFNIITDMQ